MTHLHAPFGPWQPAPLTEVVARFEGLGVPWWVAGGYAIELAAGRRLRAPPQGQGPRPKGELDFGAALPALIPGQRHWLGDALATTYRDDHPWMGGCPRLTCHAEASHSSGPNTS
ncbi:hypothetical protein ACFVY1_39730 [Streptomyces sp. NPDC058293]|uniref:hypothetical protein n=1 Tax=Streptomyces sp. NPDC058293 TaxID=3346429 RepID=UPI0036E2A4F5